jgi:hypothetical protein
MSPQGLRQYGGYELAKSLREDGLWVIILGPNGKPLDETKEDE